MSQLDHPLSDYAPGCPDELGTSPFVARPMMRPRKQAHGLVLRVILLSIIWPIAMQGAQYYVSTNGSNSNNGSLNSPWQTLQYALGRLSPGDTLYLRGGTYYVQNASTSLKGTASAPITIRSYPGERASIDGGTPDFRNTSNPAWELVNASIGLYRSKTTVWASFVRAWLIDDDIQLVEYGSQANLESTYYGPVSGFKPLYTGPGLQLRSDGRIYIRLQYNPNDLTDPSGKPITPKPANTNPNNNLLAVFTSEQILALVDAEYLHFKDLDFSYSKQIFDVRNGTHHIELDGCRLNYGSYGLVIRDNIHDWEIHDSEFNNGLPDYVYWTDVKNGNNEVAEAYPEFQSAAIEGSIPSFNIHNNVFRNTFDSFDIKDGTTNTSIKYNTFKYHRDDVMELATGLSNVEIAHNMLWHVGSGISIAPSSATPGHVYIHHNVIDNSAYQHGGRSGNYRESDWPVWTTIDPFGSHDTGNKAVWWKIYNNTIVTRRSGYDWNAAGPSPITGNSEKYVYNNIFFVIDDRIIFRDDQVSLGSHYDGDIVYRNMQGSFPFFFDFGDGGQYSSLADFKSKLVTDWELHGLQIDPGFSASAINNPAFDSATIWGRYQPTNSQVFTTGASYSRLNWPEIQGVNYRGALPANSTVTNPPIISSVTSSSVTTNSATITWSTDKASDSQVEYGTTNAYGSSTPLNSTLVTSHSVTLSGLPASTPWHYRVKSRDAAGHLAVSADFTFTTTADTAAPVISAVSAASISSSGASIKWTTNEASNSQVEYGTTTSYGNSTLLNTSLITNHLQTVGGLAASTLYHYRVKSRDAAGNLAVSGDFAFTTLSAQDTSPPLISGVTSSNISTNSATITWSTDEDSDSQVEYGLSTSYGSLSILNSTLTKSHSVNLTGLSSGQTYSYRVKSRDAAGNLAISSNFAFVTAGDTTPPGQVQNFAGVAGNAQVTLNWVNPADVDLKGVMIRYRTDGIFPANKSDGVLVADLAESARARGSFVHTGLTGGTAYSYSAFSYDAIPNYSSPAHAQATPVNVTITSLNPNQGSTGTAVVINGTGFGNLQGSNKVTFNGLTAAVSAWGATSITAAVPANATTGPVIVTVNGVQSNGMTFKVDGRLAAPSGVHVKE